MAWQTPRRYRIAHNLILFFSIFYLVDTLNFNFFDFDITINEYQNYFFKIDIMDSEKNGCKTNKTIGKIEGR
jgi:hypothetical protein